MEKKPKKVLQIDLDHLSDDELEKVTGGMMGSLPTMLAKGCACVCHGDDAEKMSNTTLSNNHLGK